MLRKISPAVALVTACAVASFVACPFGVVAPSFAVPAEEVQEAEELSDEDIRDAEIEAAQQASSEDSAEKATQNDDKAKAKKSKKQDDSASSDDDESVGKQGERVIETVQTTDEDNADSSSESISSSAAIAQAEASRDRAGDAAGKLSDLHAQLSDVRKDYEKAKKKAAKAGKQLKKLNKKVKKAKKQAARAQAVVDAVSEEIAGSKQVGLLSVVAGKASFDDIDSRMYLLQKVSQDQKDTVTRLQKLQEKQQKAVKKLKKTVKKQREAESEIKRLGNKIAFSIEKQTSAVRVHDDEAASAVEKAGDAAEDAASAKADVKAAASSHDSARASVDESVGDWYDLVDSVAEADGALSFGEGADFAMKEKKFVAKWGTAIDAFFGSRPLGGYGEAMAKAAYKYKIDPRLCAAVSIIESSGGIYCIRPHNAWGWGAADSDPYNLASQWGSWESAIEAWHEGMSSSKTGLATAKTLDELGSIYCSTADWSANVATEMEKISELAEAATEDLSEEDAAGKDDKSDTADKSGK